MAEGEGGRANDDPGIELEARAEAVVRARREKAAGFRRLIPRAAISPRVFCPSPSF